MFGFLPSTITKLKPKVMKHLAEKITLLLFVFVITSSAATAQNSTSIKDEMKTYLIERHVPGAGNLKPEELKSISQGSCTVLKEMGDDIQWIHSYVTGDKIFCVYRAKNEELIREHGKKGGFPVNEIIEIKTTISPKTAE